MLMLQKQRQESADRKHLADNGAHSQRSTSALTWQKDFFFFYFAAWKVCEKRRETKGGNLQEMCDL